MIGLWRRLRPRRRRSATVEGLADFLAARTAFVSQKSTIEYCRARAGIGWGKLFLEDEFGRAMEFCRWEAYAAVLEDLAEVALTWLRHGGAQGPEIVDGLAAATRAALLRHPAPAHRAGWDETLAAVEARLHRALLAAPRPVHEVGRGSGRRVFKVLPIHTNLTAQDREVVVNNVRFLLCRAYADMEAELDRSALLALLSGPTSPAAGGVGHGAAPPGPP